MVFNNDVAALGKRSCPVCGEEQDFTTEQGQVDALAHTKKDQRHIDWLAERRTENVMKSLVGSGLMRRVS